MGMTGLLVGPKWSWLDTSGGWASLFLLSLFVNRELEERKEGKRRLEEELGHGVNFSGLAKMRTVHEK